MTNSTQPLSLVLAADENVIRVDFAGYDGGRLQAKEQAALRIALDDAVHALNARLARVTHPRPAKPARTDAESR